MPGTPLSNANDWKKLVDAEQELVLIFCEDVKSHAQVVSTTTTIYYQRKKKWGENEKPLHASADDFWYTEKQLAAPGKGKNLTWSCIFENTLHGHMRHVYRRAETAIWDIMWMCSNTKEYWKNRIISKYDCLVWWKAVEGPPAVFTISSRFLSAKGENNRFKIISRV